MNATSECTVTLLGAVLLIAPSFGQQPSQEQESTQQTAQKTVPTLGFNHRKDMSPILDMDAYAEELETEKKLPGNQFVHDKRAMHEASLMNDVLEGFKDSKECNGITFYMKEGKTPAFTVQIGITGHDDHPDDQTWTGVLVWPGDPSPANKDTHGVGGMGSQSSARLTAKDVCLTVWDDIDPNH